jgi:hypothetical protein
MRPRWREPGPGHEGTACGSKEAPVSSTFSGVNAADAFLTEVGVRFGNAAELNPVA